MSTKVPYGKPVKLLADYQGYPDGRIVKFEIWRKTDQGEEKVTEHNGVTKGGKAMALWNPDFLKGTTFELQESEPAERVEEEKYYFIAKIDDQEVKSGDMEFTFPLTLLLKEGGEPLNGVQCKVTFSDGTKNEAKFSKGIAKFSGAPLGKFTVEVDGYTPSVLYGVLKR